MERKAAELGRGASLFYIFPAKRAAYPNSSMLQQLAQLGAQLGDRLVVDQHVHWASVTQPPSRGFGPGNGHDLRCVSCCVFDTDSHAGAGPAQTYARVAVATPPLLQRAHTARMTLHY